MVLVLCFIVVVLGVMVANAGGGMSVSPAYTPDKASRYDNGSIIIAIVICFLACVVARYA